MHKDNLINVVSEKYSEWLEMAGEDAPRLLIDILAKLLVIEKQKNDYLSKVLYGCKK